MSIPLWLQCTHLLMTTSSRIMHHVSNHLWLVSWTWQWVHFTQMASTVTRSQSNRAPLGCGGTGDSHHGCAADKSAATAWCYHVNMDQNLWGNVSNTLLNLCHEELRQFWRQKGIQPGTSKVYLIKWPVSVYVCVCTSICVYIELNRLLYVNMLIIYIYIYIYNIYIYIYIY